MLVMDARPVITVFGHSTVGAESAAWRDAYQLGQEVARAGWTLCNGGYGGTMEASARGAVEAGGHTIGVTCAAFTWRGECNPYIREEIVTANLLARLERLVELGSAFVVLPGGTGTLLELALVWELINKGLVERPAPVVLLGHHWAPLNTLIRRVQDGAVALPVVETPTAAIEHIQAAWAGQAAVAVRLTGS